MTVVIAGKASDAGARLGLAPLCVHRRVAPPASDPAVGNRPGST